MSARILSREVEIIVFRQEKSSDLSDLFFANLDCFSLFLTTAYWRGSGMVDEWISIETYVTLLVFHCR